MEYRGGTELAKPPKVEVSETETYKESRTNLETKAGRTR
jgi:hypothetical protein